LQGKIHEDDRITYKDIVDNIANPLEDMEWQYLTDACSPEVVQNDMTFPSPLNLNAPTNLLQYALRYETAKCIASSN